MRKKISSLFTGVNEKLFFDHNEENGLFGQTLYVSCFWFLVSGCFYAQPTQKIKFAKNSDLIYFFQVGEKSDTIQKNKTDLFYLLVPDSLKESISIQVENAKFEETKNDSIVKLSYLPGLKYESLYLQRPFTDAQYKKAKEFELKTLVNGTSTFDRKNILIQVIEKRKNLILIENIFVFFAGD